MLEICLGNKTDTALYGAELIRVPGSICEFFTSAEREVKVSRRPGMYQSYNFLTRLGKQSL